MGKENAKTTPRASVDLHLACHGSSSAGDVSNCISRGEQLNDEQEDEEDEADASSVSPSNVHWEAQCLYWDGVQSTSLWEIIFCETYFYS